jgi:hypothetical protein
VEEMCCSRASLAFSDFTRASVEIRSSLLYSSLGEEPIFSMQFLHGPGDQGGRTDAAPTTSLG